MFLRMKILMKILFVVEILGCYCITVSNRNGENVPFCGSKNTRPCKTIEYAVSRTQPGKCQIVLDGGCPTDGFTSPAVYELNSTISAENDFTITNMENTSRPIIVMFNNGQQQQQQHQQHQFFFSADSKQRQILHFSNIIFRQMSIVNVTTVETEIRITNCYVESSPSSVVNSNTKHLKTKLIIRGSSFHNCAGLTMLCDLDDGEFVVADSSFTADYNSAIFTGFHVTNVTSRLVVGFKNSTFETIRKPLELHVAWRTGGNVGSATIVDSLFKWNRSPVNITGCKQVIVQDTEFLENTRGALQLTEVTNVVVNRARFVGNSKRSALSLITNNLVFINASKFYDNSDEYHGGAIFSYGSRVVVQYSTFERNFAPLAGGTIYHAASILSCCELDLKNVSVSSALDKSSRSGTLISSSQKVKLTNFNGKLERDEWPFTGAYVDGMVSSHSIVVVKQGHFQFTCPVNNNPEVIQAKYISRSGIVVTPSGAESMGCRKCLRQTYSLQSTSMKTSRFICAKQQCLKCPKGGNCTNGIVSRDNFWGYRDENCVRFLPCPSSHCCSKDTVPCETYQACGSNREGVLCGACKPSHTLSYFTNTCTENASCNRTLFWCLYAIYTCAIVIMLMYFEKFFLALKRLWNELKKNSNKDEEESLVTPSESESQLTQLLLDDYDDNNRRLTQPSEQASSNHSDNGIRVIDQSCDNDTMVNQPNSSHSESSSTTNNSNTKDLINGFAKIIFFFYQTEHLLRVNSTIEKDYGLLTRLKYLSTSVFNLHLESNRATSLCPMLELNKPVKELIKLSTVFLCLFIVCCLYMTANCCKWWSKKCSIQQRVVGESPMEFQLHLKQCLVKLLLFGYANMIDFSLIMLNCVDILGTKYLYHYGQLVCYTRWQIVIFIFFVTWILPFPLAIKFGVSMLRKHQISLRTFYFILVCPSCFIIFYANSKRKRAALDIVTEEQDEELKLLLKIFSGPFRDVCVDGSDNKTAPITWDSVILMRRLLLSLVCGFLINPVNRLCATFPMLVTIFILHISYRPFKLPILNRVEIASLSLLLWLNTANLFWAFSYMNNISDMPGFDLLATVFGIVEDVVLALPALCVMLAVVGFLLKKCCLCCYKCWRESLL